MYRRDCLDRFHFDDDFAIDDYVRSKAEVELNIFVKNRNAPLTNDTTTPLLKLIGQCGFVNGFV